LKKVKILLFFYTLLIRKILQVFENIHFKNNSPGVYTLVCDFGYNILLIVTKI